MSFGNWRCPTCNTAGAWTPVDRDRLLCDGCGRVASKRELRAIAYFSDRDRSERRELHIYLAADKAEPAEGA